MSKLILHLDDEPAIRELIAAALTDQGYRVVSVPTLTEALGAIEKEPPHLVITDLQLDVGDGFEAIAALQTPLLGVPIIVLTGALIDPRVAKKSLALSVSSYLPKTSSLTKIVEEVRRLAGQ